MSSTRLVDPLREEWGELNCMLQKKEAERRKLQDEIDDLKKRINACGTLLRSCGEEVIFDDLAGKTIKEAAMAVLSDPSAATEGLPIKELIKLMKERGWNSKARNPAVSIAGGLARYDEFENIGKNVWRLKGKENDSHEEVNRVHEDIN